MPSLLDKAKNAKRESKYVEFKESFGIVESGEWCEIVKDIVAIANTGGGVIVFGVDNLGRPTVFDATTILSLDPAKITDKIFKYSGIQFCDFEIRRIERNGVELAALFVQGADTPIVFTKPGTYSVGSKQKRAFSQGTVYFRHGAKSEPGTTDDLRNSLDRRLEEIRKDWLSGVKRVVTAPAGSTVNVVAKDARYAVGTASIPIRVTDDPSAPAFRVTDPDKTHPYRQTELIEEVMKRLPNGMDFNQFDVRAIRGVYEMSEESEYVHFPKFTSPQYSRAFVEWIGSHCDNNPNFLAETRSLFRGRDA